ncbi:hypothetical protein HYPSUDRAFT_232948 [Hypholoma sublateritium FD-334 SS-4]|uniref:Uncharacterized protein n=1 Tax=Hypholoma sublateritium (strain FD-334 SS-4) TaxID=945553 RepID=A0A0D2PNI8_HYPSF|nr:hypothetical protein HYPSUDRAFT_232948 [Hypholoma sublateritium FD-334 SS-4]
MLRRKPSPRLMSKSVSELVVSSTRRPCLYILCLALHLIHIQRSCRPYVISSLYYQYHRSQSIYHCQKKRIYYHPLHYEY